MLHNRELAGWRPASSDNYPNPQPSEIVIFDDFFKWGFGSQSILSFKVFVCITTLGFAISIPAQFSLFLFSSTCVRRMGESNPILTSLDIYSA
jgi:hypothetical protein